MPSSYHLYGANRFSLELDGEPSGWLLSAEGGQPITETVQSRVAGAWGARKFAGTTKFEEITVSCGTGMSRQFYEWLEKSLKYDHEFHDGALVSADMDMKETSRLTFSRALLTEFSMPALDAKKSELCHITAKFSPESTKTVLSPSSAGNRMRAKIDQRTQHLWTSSAFRLTIDGFDCENVSAIDALTFKQKIIENPAGETPYADKHPVNIEFPDLVITLPERDAGPWYQWREDFVVKGNSGPQNERGGHLEFLLPSRGQSKGDVLFTLNFPILGIVKITPDKLESGQDKIRNVKITMYTEKVDFKYGAPAIGLPATWA